MCANCIMRSKNIKYVLCSEQQNIKYVLCSEQQNIKHVLCSEQQNIKYVLLYYVVNKKMTKKETTL